MASRLLGVKVNFYTYLSYQSFLHYLLDGIYLCVVIIKVESMAGITPRTSLLDPCVKLSPYTAPDSIRLCLLLMCK